jgi:CubicO group peptidase (beta-lactamase class C family)
VTTTINGFCDGRFESLRDAFRANFDDGLEIGASLAVTHRGEPVVDLWAGHADRNRTRPWERDTLIFLSSSTKIPLVVSFLMLVDRGLVELDAPIAHYWPEFAAGGKERVTVREALSHRGAIPGFDPPIDVAALLDWNAITTHLAAQSHWFGGRSVLCYHPVTYGFLLGEIMRRVDGRTPAQFWREEIATPAHIDLQIGLRSKSELPRVAEVVWATPPAFPVIQDPAMVRAFQNGVPQGDWSAWDVMSADISASNGYGNARSIARVGSIIAQRGELDGHRYLSTAVVAEAMSTQIDAIVPVFGRMRWGLGVTLDHDEFRLPTPTSAYWGGGGGSFIVMDPAAGVSCGYAMNNHVFPKGPGPEARQQRLWSALGEVIAKL